MSTIKIGRLTITYRAIDHKDGGNGHAVKVVEIRNGTLNIFPIRTGQCFSSLEELLRRAEMAVRQPSGKLPRVLDAGLTTKGGRNRKVPTRRRLTD